MKLSEGGSALLLPFCFTWLLHTSKPETYTHGFLGQIQDLPRHYYKVVLGVFAQLESAPQKKQMSEDFDANLYASKNNNKKKKNPSFRGAKLSEDG